MSVVQYTDVSIGAASSDLFSNVGGTADLQVKWLWSYTTDRDLRLAFEEVISDTENLTLQAGDLSLEFPEGSSGESSFKWTGVYVDWEDGQTISASIVATPATEAPQPNTPATGQPTISGTAKVNQTLTADTSGISDADGLTNVSYSFQWIADDADISGAAGSTYTPSVSDVGKTIKVRVSFTDDKNNQESLTSSATAAVAATVPGQPLSLTVVKGDRIRELDASWQPPTSNGGSDITVYKLQWKETGDNWDTADDVSEATTSGTSYTITGLTGGDEYAVRVIATNGAGGGPASAEVTESPAGGTSPQNVEPENNAPTGLPTISGTAQVGQTLTASTSGITDEDGLDDVSYSYQWIRNDGKADSNIAGATGSTYELVDADQNKTIRVKVSFTDDRNNNESLTSAATSTVAAQPNNPASGAPIINGTAQVGQTLTASTTGITDADGLDDVSYTYQWIRNDGNADSDIQDATASTYTLSADDEGKTIKVRVTFTDDRNHQEALSSEPLGPVDQETSPQEGTAPGTVPTAILLNTGLASLSITDQNGETLDIGAFDTEDRTYSRHRGERYRVDYSCGNDRSHVFVDFRSLATRQRERIRTPSRPDPWDQPRCHKRELLGLGGPIRTGINPAGECIW